MTLGRIVVCIPTYDERDTLPVVVGRLRAAVPEADILVLDDNSPDGTGAVADRLAAEDAAGQVHVVHRPGKSGLGATYLAGFAWALERDYDVIVEMDADGSHAPEELPRLLAGLETGADLVLGSRYVPGGQLVGWPRSREVLSRGGNTYARLALGLELRDATGGFRAYRADVLRKLALADVSSQGYCFQVDLAWRTVLAGFTVLEVPITFTEREVGSSKMSRAVVAEAFLRIGGWGVRRRLSRPRAGGS